MIIVICGAAASGKSELAKALASGHCGVVVSIDEVVYALSGGMGYSIDALDDIAIAAAGRAAKELSESTDAPVIVDYAFLEERSMELFLAQLSQPPVIVKLVTPDAVRAKYNKARVTPCSDSVLQEEPPRYVGEVVVDTDVYHDIDEMEEDVWVMITHHGE